jgi:hypothetical protein
LCIKKLLMKITLCGSIMFIDEMFEVKKNSKHWDMR